jgi:hypothetical protein
VLQGYFLDEAKRFAPRRSASLRITVPKEALIMRSAVALGFVGLATDRA